jgi:hypothetical protein
LRELYELDPEFVTQRGMAPAADKPPKICGIAPAHGHTEGWDECLPPSMGRGDLDVGIHWV